MNSPRKAKNILFIVLGTALIGALGFWVFKPMAGMADRSVDYKGSALSLLAHVHNSNTDWSGKVVEIKGRVTSIDQKGVTLDQGIYCQLTDSINITQLEKGLQIQLKGIVLGYDELYDELKIAQCIIR